MASRPIDGPVGFGRHASDFADAILQNDRARALRILRLAVDTGWSLRDVESNIVEPAVTRLGELWVRGRLDDQTFKRVGELAERVEWSFRHSVAAQRST